MRNKHLSTGPHLHPASAVLISRGISQLEVADAIGYSPQNVNDVLRGRWRGSRAFREGMCRFLGMAEEELFAPEARVWRWRVERLAAAAPPGAAEDAGRVMAALGAGR